MKVLEILTEEETIVQIKVSGDFANNFKKFIEDVSNAAAGGAGTELKAITGSGEVAKCYIDGDGADRIELVK
jgi:hypothetical protein